MTRKEHICKRCYKNCCKDCCPKSIKVVDHLKESSDAHKVCKNCAKENEW